MWSGIFKGGRTSKQHMKLQSGPKKRVITKGVFSLEESLESLNSLESLESGRILLCFPQSGGSLDSLTSLNSLESLEKGLFWKDPFSKRPLFPNPIQQPRNYDFRASQFDPPRSQSGNDRETTTFPPGHHWEANVALTTTAKLQQLRVNSREMTTFAESCNDREMPRPRNDKLESAQLLQNLRQILRRFVAVVVSSAF